MKNSIKLILIVLIIVISTGCSATYNVTITKNNFIESLELSDLNINDKQLEKISTNPIPVDIDTGSFLDYDTDIEPNEIKKEEGVDYYTTKVNDNNLNFLATIPFSYYNNSRIANSFFNNINVNNYDDMISIYGYNGIAAFTSYPELDSVKINITSKLDVVKDNADLVNNNVYTWYFDRKTSSDKTLYIQVNPNKSNKNNHKLTKEQLIILIVCFTFIVLMPIIYILSKKRKYH